MIKTFKSEDGKITVAVKEGTKYDAVEKVAKRLHLGTVTYTDDSSYAVSGMSGCDIARLLRLDELLMSNRYSGRVTCSEEDVPDEKIGRDEAVKKVRQHHRDGVEKAVMRWQYAMIKRIKSVNPKTFERIRWYI